MERAEEEAPVGGLDESAAGALAIMSAVKTVFAAFELRDIVPQASVL